MRLTRKSSTPRPSLAYLAGVLLGDGWCGKDAGLRVKDRDFLDAFITATRRAFGLILKPRFDGYWVARTQRTDLFHLLRRFEPINDREKALWVRGLFDSEGNAQLRLNGISENSYGRRVAIYSTARSTLESCGRHLSQLDIPTYLRATKNSSSHKGTLVVYELSVKGGKDNYARFARVVGSSIGRKQSVLDAIPKSYRPNIARHFRKAQREGARVKRSRTVTETLPMVIKAIHQMVSEGIRPTYRRCGSIPGYHAVRHFMSHARLLQMEAKLPLKR